MKKLDVKFDTKPFSHGSHIALNDVQVQPTINFTYDPNKTYVLLMVDPDAPSCLNPTFKYYLHWLQLNDSDVFPYTPPNPPANSGEHRYYIIMYEQVGGQHILDKNQVLKEIGSTRAKFDVTGFGKKHGLVTVAAVMFKTNRGESSICQDLKDGLQI